ncbi:hypothetical protein COU16_02970 [Candidatus Kaiserbacteria bacterium CG10_big_fil_rev_8_21_14_0_10_47_16]|uniref:Uncharacterized protein n=1 Tax=Candidatus Kaiserbacteria bacterium CG10_big_fil_rev_8_21_14_0_10_47_16 TaxID=1974608 RepID=A0A2H0UDL1_9BACT|nr:MAG: hypothetical protein COU16_02970 [Candidatus Kaiserbacteria bacterium CG10_big_fil_rev_8_21_14_0_10_47_16]
MMRISDDAVSPRARWVFVSRDVTFWTLWGGAVLIGSAALAASAFATEHAGWEFYEATHRNMITFIVTVLPYLWIGILAGTVLFGYFNLRHTKTGYRYSLTIVMIMSIGGSFVGGAILYGIGAGSTIEVMVGERIPFHTSVVRLQEELWDDADEGRLIGSASAPLTEETILFTDTNGTKWTLYTAGLSPKDLDALARFEEVRVIGYQATTSDDVFYACIILPGFLPHEQNSISDMLGRRSAFLERVRPESEIKDPAMRSNECERVRVRILQK